MQSEVLKKRWDLIFAEVSDSSLSAWQEVLQNLSNENAIFFKQATDDTLLKFCKLAQQNYPKQQSLYIEKILTLGGFRKKLLSENILLPTVVLTNGLKEKESFSQTEKQAIIQQIKMLSANLINEFAQKNKLKTQLQKRNIKAAKPTLDFNKTILKNLKNYQPATKKIIVEKLFFQPAKNKGYNEIVLLVDCSASMQNMLIEAILTADVIASLPKKQLRLFVFNEVCNELKLDHTELLHFLFDANLDGATNINRAVNSALATIQQPQETLFILLSDFINSEENNDYIEKLIHLKEKGATILPIVPANVNNFHFYDKKAISLFQEKKIRPIISVKEKIINEIIDRIIG